MKSWSSVGGLLGAVLVSDPQATVANTADAQKSLFRPEYDDIIGYLREGGEHSR
jgi:flagellar motor component MotA